MRQSLQLRLGQQLTMTPQLRQAIRLLQLSTLDLQTEIQEALDSNLMLEREDDQVEFSPADGADPQAITGPESTEKSDAASEESSVETDYDPLDGLAYESIGGLAQPEDDDRDPFARQAGDHGSLQEYLRWQADLTPFTDTDRVIAAAIIDGIDESGYLRQSVEEIAQAAARQLDEPPEDDEIEAVLHRVQRFDPPGVAARTPGECLLLQLDQLPPATACREAARRLVRDHLELLAARDFTTLMRKLKLSREELQAVVGLIQSLNPHPGTDWASEPAQYVVPDVFVSRQRNNWKVTLNPEIAPRIRINSGYAGMVRRADSSADNTYLRNQLQEARWFLKSLHNRNETLLRVAMCIVEQQRAFLEHGDEHMKPMVLRDIAEMLEMHESTISRVTTQKYMHTPRGIYEFKFFFSSHVGTSDGGEASSVAIRAMIKKLIGSENPQKPLSDAKIADMLDESGINVARRTVAKYREAMNIPSSSDRKRLA